MSPLEQTIGNMLLSSRRAAAEGFRRNIEKRIDYYNDKQLSYLNELISENFSHSEPLAAMPSFFNIIKPIINEISMIYRSGARRTIFKDSGDAADPRVLALWQSIQNTSRYDAAMKTVNRMVNLCKTALVKVAFRNGAIKLDILTPDKVEVLPDNDDPTEAAAIFYTRADKSVLPPQNIVHYWDKSRYLRINTFGEQLDNPRNPDGINPYGVLPFARFVNQIPLDGFFVNGGDDLVIAQDNINLKLTQLNYIVKMQSFSVPVLIGYRGPEKIAVSPGKPIIVPLGTMGETGNPDFRFETPNPQIAELVNLLEHEITRIFRAYGIGGSDFSLQGGTKSGFALVMENLKLLESRENDLPFYEDGEEELFEIVKKVWNYHSDFLPSDHPFYAVKFDDDCRLQVSVNDISLPKATSEDIAEWKFMIEHKLATPIDYLMRRYKLSEQEAKDRLANITTWWNDNITKTEVK
jgi:hypothetical protein